MTKWIKRSAFLLALLVLLTAIGVVLAITAIDPNQWKGQIQRAASQQGIQLEIQGDLSWQFFPSLGVRIGKAKLDLSQPHPDAPLIQFDQAIARIAVMPLLDRVVNVEEITVQSPAIFLADSNNTNNYTLDTKRSPERNTNTPKDTPSQNTQSDKPLDINIAVIAITDGQVNYQDSKGTSWAVNALNLKSQQLNLTGQPFSLDLDLQIDSDTLPISPKLGVSGTLSFDAATQSLNWQNGELSIEADKNHAHVNFNVAGALSEPLNLSGELQLAETNARHWLQALEQPLPDMNRADALTRLHTSFNFSLSNSDVNLSNIKLVFDQSQLAGNLRLQTANDSKPNVTSTLNIDHLNLDEYLPKTDDNNSNTTSSTNQRSAQTNESPLPLDSLNSIDADLTFNINSFAASGLTLDKVNGRITGKDGTWTLNPLTANGYEGSIRVQAMAKARDSQLYADINGTLSSLEAKTLLTDLAEFSDLSGKLNVSINGKTQARFPSQLLPNSSATLTANSDALQVDGINFEKYYCTVAYQLDQTSEIPSSWTTYSKVDDFQLRIQWQDQYAKIADLQADASNLHVTAAGGLNWETQQFAARFPLSISQEKTSSTGCMIRSKFLQQEAIDIVRCKGSLTDLDLSDACGIDSEGVKDLAKEALRYNADKKIDKKKKEIREELKEKLWEAFF